MYRNVCTKFKSSSTLYLVARREIGSTKTGDCYVNLRTDLLINVSVNKHIFLHYCASFSRNSEAFASEFRENNAPEWLTSTYIIMLPI